MPLAQLVPGCGDLVGSKKLIVTQGPVDGFMVNLNIGKQARCRWILLQGLSQQPQLRAQLIDSRAKFQSVRIRDWDTGGRNPANLVQLIIRRTIG
jgi:hypothetical protein